MKRYVTSSICMNLYELILLISLCELHKLHISISLFANHGIDENAKGGIMFSQPAKRHLQDVLKMSCQDKQDILPRHLADVQKMS